jgi:hypothetical protein
MALLLRMGGVPARVATGFTPGTLDTTRKEYVVRDLDAHSWVEAYFPSYGWVTFDPTPAIAPPRSQSAGIDPQDTASAADQESRTGNAAADRSSDAAGIDNGTAAKGARSAPIARYIAFGLGGTIVVGLAALAVRRRRRLATMTAEDYVRELERALRRSGRTPVAGLTLSAIEHRLGATSDAAGYVRTLRDGRYGFGAGIPSQAQRSALRRELRAGPGLGGRIRALWALPPW